MYVCIYPPKMAIFNSKADDQPWDFEVLHHVFRQSHVQLLAKPKVTWKGTGAPPAHPHGIGSRLWGVGKSVAASAVSPRWGAWWSHASSIGLGSKFGYQKSTNQRLVGSTWLWHRTVQVSSQVFHFLSTSEGREFWAISTSKFSTSPLQSWKKVRCTVQNH